MKQRKMKDSGIDWIGQIPEWWEIKKTKFVSQLYTGNSISDGEKDQYTDSKAAIPYIATKDITIDYNIINYNNGMYVKCDNYDFVRAQKNDILMCIEGGSAGRKKAMLDRTVCFVNKLCCFHTTSVISRFLYFIINSPHYEDEFRFYIDGLIGGVSKTKLKNIYLPIPPFAEQQRIADYLDKQCGEIDAQIETLTRLIERLDAYKKSMISHVVTKGLNPNTPMKDSGIDWIGQIPEGWKVSRLKMYSRIFGRIGFRGYTQQDLVDESNGAITLSPSNIDKLNVSYKKCSYISWAKYDESPEIQIANGDIIFVKTGSSYGKNAIVENLPQKATINPQLIVFKKIKTNKHFFLYSLQSSVCAYQTELAVVGGTIPTMSQQKIENFLIILPPPAEQQRIADYLDTQCEKIETQKETIRTTIDKLAQYKKSLIYEVVTGKKEV